VSDGEQDHSGVAVTVSVALGSLEQCVHLVGGEVLGEPLRSFFLNILVHRSNDHALPSALS
jgi:hypothetical protein